MRLLELGLRTGILLNGNWRNFAATYENTMNVRVPKHLLKLSSTACGCGLYKAVWRVSETMEGTVLTVAASSLVWPALPCGLLPPAGQLGNGALMDDASLGRYLTGGDQRALLVAVCSSVVFLR